MHADTPDDAEQLFALGRFEESEAAYRRRIRTDLENAGTLARVGQLALLSNRLEDAMRHLGRALELDPALTHVRPLLAEAHCRHGDLGAAAALMRSAGDEARARQLEIFRDKRAYVIPGGWETTTIPFLLTDPLPVIEARVNGSAPVNLLIDTGAGELILDPEFAAAIGVASLSSKTSTFAGGQQTETQCGYADMIELGGLSIRNVPVDLLPTRRFAAAAGGLAIDGILGTVLLSRFRFTLDYPGGQLILHNRSTAPETLASGTAVTRIPIWMAGDHFIVAWGCVNAAPPMLFFVDTGLAGGGFVAPPSTLEAAGIHPDGPSFEGIGGGGAVQVTPFMVDRLSLGDVTGEDIIGFAGVFPEFLEHRFGFRIGGIVSHQFLRPYQVTFDLDRMELMVGH